MTQFLTSSWLWTPLAVLGVVVIVAMVVLVGAVCTYLAAYLAGRVRPPDAPDVPPLRPPFDQRPASSWPPEERRAA